MLACGQRLPPFTTLEIPNFMRTLFINGKFSAQRVTGVQRIAASLVQALDQLLQDTGTPDRWVLVCPPGATPPSLAVIEVRIIGPRRGGLHLWEQSFLPLYTAGRTLLNLAGPAPLFKRRQVCMIADAAVFDQPAAYTRTFGYWYRFLFRSVSRSARLVLTISEFSRMRLQLALGHPSLRIEVVHCAGTHLTELAADPSIVDRLKLSKDSYLLAVASANPTKNLPALVDAFRVLKDDRLRLVLVGGSNAAVFADHQNNTPDDATLIRTGPVSDAQLKALYQGALAFVFPSLYEGFGLPPLEAMSMGCPVIASRAASIPEVCADAAEYFDPNSTADIARSMTRVLQDAKLREAMRLRGFERIKQFSWRKAALALLTHLRDVDLAGGARA